MAGGYAGATSHRGFRYKLRGGNAQRTPYQTVSDKATLARQLSSRDLIRYRNGMHQSGPDSFRWRIRSDSDSGADGPILGLRSPMVRGKCPRKPYTRSGSYAAHGARHGLLEGTVSAAGD